MHDGIRKVHSYCIHCAALCGIVAHIKDGRLLKVEGDPEATKNAGTLCPKALAATQEIYHPDRLKYPIKRTGPKGKAPGWVRITWDEALDTITRNMEEIREQYGPESFFFQKGSTGGSSGKEWYPFYNRLANLYGSPNFGGTGHICCYSTSCPGLPLHLGNKHQPPAVEWEKTACVLLVGSNMLHTKPNIARKLLDAKKRGVKLIVVDPMLTPTASKADLWLAPRPGSDLALLLAMHHVIVREGFYDPDFLAAWTNAPFLVRDDDGRFLRDEQSRYMVCDDTSGKPCPADPWTPVGATPALDGSCSVGGVSCRPAWQLFCDLVSSCTPEWAEPITWIAAADIEKTAGIFATTSPAAVNWYNGLHKGSNAHKTAVALALLPVITGNWDIPGGFITDPDYDFGDVKGRNRLPENWIEKSLVSAAGYKVRAYGLEQVGPMNLVADAILTGKPYPIKGMLSIASGMATSNPNSKKIMQALEKLDFLAVGDIWKTPAMEAADIILPCATPWESEFVNVNPPHIMYRRPLVTPQHESRAAEKIIFELAGRLGYAKDFFDGDLKKGFAEILAPLAVSMDQLEASPRGVPYHPPERQYRKYARIDPETGRPRGVDTPTGRLEIYSDLFKSLGYDPLPSWVEPAPGPVSTPEMAASFPLILCSGYKPMHWLHGQLRAVPWLRECDQGPLVWVNRRTAAEMGIRDGDEVLVEAPGPDGEIQGFLRLKAFLTESVHPKVIYIPYGWWQGCSPLGFMDSGNLDGSANVNNLYDDSSTDPVSGTIGMVSYPCRLRKEQ
ncbi:MAG: molybdopterin-dependent oxidoreductase [Deltaproteobacteria bacterium]|nr:molybdopterin-dependent oxidoreductase [Deltaproteobacteria bacterium]